MDYKNILVTSKNDIGWITMNRPQAMNALNNETIYELERIFIDFNNNDKVKAIIITGEGKAFIAGADIAEMENMDPLTARQFSQTGQRTLAFMEKMEKPVLAAINGFALGGGCELAMACDIRIASEKAKFGQPEVGLGIIPGFAGTQRLARICGIGKAKELIFTGDIITAVEAERIGLVNRVVAPDKLLNEVKGLAEKIVRNGPIAVRLAKTVINRGCDCDIETGSAYESEAFAVCFATGQPKTGMQAFLDKTKPQW